MIFMRVLRCEHVTGRDKGICHHCGDLLKDQQTRCKHEKIHACDNIDPAE